MANIANGYLSINLDKNSELNKNKIYELVKHLENNNLFKYEGDCEVIFDEEAREINLDFTGKWSCDYCWDWINNQISDINNDEELSLESRMLLLNSEIIGGSYEYGTQYRDRIYKKNGSNKLEIYNHIKLDSGWPEVLEIINAYDLKEYDSQIFDNSVEISLCEKSVDAKYLFKIVGGVGGFITLINKESNYIEFFCDIDSFTSKESIDEILKGLKSGDLVQEEEPEEWYGNEELIDDLIGNIDKFFELQ